MIDLVRMKTRSAGVAGGVCWDVVAGMVIDIADQSDAMLLVEEVTDAVKSVDGKQVVGSLDREGLWSVRGVVLGGDVLDGLPAGKLDLNEVIEMVRDAGVVWQVERFSPSGP